MIWPAPTFPAVSEVVVTRAVLVKLDDAEAAELAELAATHTRGDVSAMAGLLLRERLRPTAFDLQAELRRTRAA